VLDEFTRECLTIDVNGGIRSGRGGEVLTQLVSVHGAPRYQRSDNGPAFVARAILRLLQQAEIETALVDPDEPKQNGPEESFNGRLRAECLNVHGFASMEDAQQQIDAFRWDYNEHHPHRALGALSPREYAQRAMTTAADSPSQWTKKPGPSNRCRSPVMTDPKKPGRSGAWTLGFD
jgi:putative transposase